MTDFLEDFVGVDDDGTPESEIQVCLNWDDNTRHRAENHIFIKVTDYDGAEAHTCLTMDEATKVRDLLSLLLP